jgi:hypothetical protein
MSGDGGPMLLHGADVWHYPWHPRHEQASLPHPQYPDQVHSLPVYDVDLPQGRVRLAAGEVSAGGFAMYWQPAP